MLVHTKNQPTISCFFNVFETCFLPNALGNVGATISSSALVLLILMVLLQCSFEDDALSATGTNNSQYMGQFPRKLRFAINIKWNSFRENCPTVKML